MTQNANYFKLGLFVILSFCIAVGFLIVFGAGTFFKKEILAETCFDESVQGLDVGSEVKYKGVRIGTVKTITTPARVYGTPSNYVLVIFSLDEDIFAGSGAADPEQAFADVIQNGLKVYLSFKGLTGAAYLETDYFPDTISGLDITWDPRHLYVPSRKSSIKRLGDAVNLILENLSQINVLGMTANLEALLETLNTKTADFDLAGISGQTTAMLAEIRQTNQQLSDTIGSPKFRQMIQDAQGSFAGIRAMVDNAEEPVSRTLEDLEYTAASARTLTSGLEARTDKKLSRVSEQIDTLLQSLNSTVKMLETLVWLNTETINRTIDNFEHTSENLKQLSLEIKQYPGRLLLERPPKRHPENRFGEEK
ncbi:MAG TPA: MlaD family protein [Desulfotignum sp.]|nr:MlaD family protein [Desulfotignum sp.]